MKKFLVYFIASNLLLVTIASISLAKLDPEMAVGVWLMDEGAGKTTADSSLFGENHEGEINGAKWVDGKFGKALEFDGGQWVEIPSTPELQMGKQLTMMAWFFAKNIGDWRLLITKNDEYILRIDPPGEGNKMSAFVKPGGNWEPRASAMVPDLETWTHFAATYDSKDGALKVYVNGVQAGSSMRPGKVASTANPVEIGRRGGGSFFVGIIDEAAIFKDVVLEESDLQTIMDEGLEVALYGEAVSSKAKLSTTWAKIKSYQ